MVEVPEPPWRQTFICGAYASVGSRARIIRAHLDADADDAQDSLERGHLLRAVQFLESAEREIGGLPSDEARAALPATEYGSYLDDEIGAVLMRIKDYAETIGGTAAGMHAYEQQLSEREQEDARKIERLLGEAFAVLDG